MFDEIKTSFLQEVNNITQMDEISPELVISFDKTGIHYVPATSWTMEKEGAKRVEIIGKTINVKLLQSWQEPWLEIFCLYTGSIPRKNQSLLAFLSISTGLVHHMQP